MNLLNVTGTDFLIVDEYQQGVEISEIDGKPNIVELLYTEEMVNQYITSPKPDQNGYNVV